MKLLVDRLAEFAARVGRRVGHDSLPHFGVPILARLAIDCRGQIAVVFGLAMVAVMIAVGGGVDLGRAYLARQQLSNVATLACQFASRGVVLGQAFGAGSSSGLYGSDTYKASVTSFVATSLSAQHFPWSQTVATPFTYVQGTSSGQVSLAAGVPTSFMGIVGVATMPVAVAVQCNGIGAPPPAASTNLVESFENAACAAGTSCYVFYNPNGAISGGNPTPQNTPSRTASYVGASGTEWVGTGYCLEVDSAGIVEGSVPDGSHSAELDCDNAAGSAGNSSLSTKVYMQAGNYELRWNFAARIDYPTYDPVQICGSSAADTVWANDSVPTYLTRTNQINVYLDANSTGSPPLHTTLDGTQQLAGSNLIDTCVYASKWIERSVAISVTSAGYYWLSFAADGHNDSYGGQIDFIRLCAGTCTASTVPDNFPSSWLPANNGGANKQLFRETFESPAATLPCQGCAFVDTTLDVNYGSTGTPSSGWPGQPATRWITTPYDSIRLYLAGSAQGAQSVGLDATASAQVPSSNRSIHRELILNPGYYELDYDYVPTAMFQNTPASVYCSAAPTNLSAYAISGGQAANDRIGGAAYTANYDTNIVAAFMSNAQLVSAPSSSRAAPFAIYANPDGTTTATPKMPPDGVNFSTYNGAQVNPVLDICGFATSSQIRTSYVRIIKTGQYWLTFAGLGTADSRGGVIDDVRLTALGSLAMASPPPNAVTVPVPDPQPGATINYPGFSIVAERTP